MPDRELPPIQSDDIDATWKDWMLRVMIEADRNGPVLARSYYRRFQCPAEIDDEAPSVRDREGFLEVGLPTKGDREPTGRWIPLE